MRATIVKALAVLAVGLAGAGCSSMPAPIGPSETTFTADFANIAGMYAGNEVSILGLPVGSIDKVEPKGSFVRVTLKVDSDVKVPADALAFAVTPTLVTDRHMELYPAYKGDGPTLADGDHIPIQRTKTPIEMDRVLETVNKLSASLRGDGKTEGPMSARILIQVLEGNGDRLRESIDALATTVQLGVTNRDAVSNAIVKLNELTQIIAENDRTVRDFSNQTTRLIDMIAEQAPGLQAVLAQLNAFLTNTATMLEQNRDALHGTVGRLTNVTAQLRENSRRLTELVDVAPMAVTNLGNTVSPQDRAVRFTALTDKALLGGELTSLLCEQLHMDSPGCRSGKLKDFGPDFGLTAALLGMTR